MARHAPDPRGVGRIVTTAVMVTVMVGLIVVGGYALYSALRPGSTKSAAGDAGVVSPASSRADTAAGLVINVTGVRCHVFVRVPGGDILLDRVLIRGERMAFQQPDLEVVLSDGGAAEVTYNGRPASVGKPGRRAEFSVSPSGVSPSR